MKRIVLASALALLPWLAHASDQSDCKIAAGTYLTGKVTSKPYFRPGGFLKGIQLSHTHFKLKADQDGKTYDVSVDNVFATGYNEAGESVPMPLKTIAVGQRLALCGAPFPGGIHWVHPNCGKKPSPNQPNGWIKLADSRNRATGDSLTSNLEYCRLWRGRRMVMPGEFDQPFILPDEEVSPES